MFVFEIFWKNNFLSIWHNFINFKKNRNVFLLKWIASNESEILKTLVRVCLMKNSDSDLLQLLKYVFWKKRKKLRILR